jgi:hypothetical protein
MLRVPFRLPGAKGVAAGSGSTVIQNQGGYDITIGGLGFRLANDTQFPYKRASEQMSAQKISSSSEPGEQSLAELPWIRSQSSFHGGAGQRNLETAYTAFQYQQEQIEHVRYDTSQGVDVWTPGKVSRLPDTIRHSLSGPADQMVTANVNNIDYAIVGGLGVFQQVAWPSGVDSAPTITAIDLTSATFGGVANCTIADLCTDGRNYYAVLQLFAQGSTPGILTYIISGDITSTAAPTALYEVPNYTSFPPRTNLCTNPRFQLATTGWTAAGGAPPALATAARPAALAAADGTQCLKVTYATGTSGQFNGPSFTLATTIGTTYTVSGYAYVPTGSPNVGWLVGAGFGGTTNGVVNQWVRLSYTFTATASSHNLVLWASGSQTSGQLSYLTGVLIEASGGVGAFFDGGTSADAQYTYSWTGSADASTSSAAPITSAQQAPGVCGWVKERLVAAVSSSLYELNSNASSHSALPTAKYTHPNKSYLWSDISESPTAILLSGASGGLSTILAFTLDTNGNTPTLGGGATIGTLPQGETINAMLAVLGSFLAVATSKGVRVGTFDTYTGSLTFGPIIWDNQQANTGHGSNNGPNRCLATRDRFVYAGCDESQADGKSGLFRIDLGTQTDAAGRNAWAPDLRTSIDAPTGQYPVWAVGVLPFSQRVIFLTSEGIFNEGNGPGTLDTCFVRTSRIRFGTTIPKLFKLGQVRGTLDTAQVQVTCIAPYGNANNCGTFGNSLSDPGDFRLIDGTWEWVQMQFNLLGGSCILSSYNVQAIPQQHRQRVIQFAVQCYSEESDRYGELMTEPATPRDRLLSLEAIEQGGGEVQFVEFTNSGAVTYKVVIQQLEFTEFSRPNIDDDLGGIIQIQLRTTES